MNARREDFGAMGTPYSRTSRVANPLIGRHPDSHMEAADVLQPPLEDRMKLRTAFIIACSRI